MLRLLPLIGLLSHIILLFSFYKIKIKMKIKGELIISILFIIFFRVFKIIKENTKVGEDV
jgi:hypothetical protein